MEEAVKRLNISFQDQTIVALTDHICFAVERYETGTELPNLVLTEIKTLYKEEYKIGLWSIQLIEKNLVSICRKMKPDISPCILSMDPVIPIPIPLWKHFN